ncbi:MAG: hypothetical protein KDE27_19470 [Planctomycetes bacterium]|nr:hypothetical protein [Planctomycetota bacterium]
MRRSSALFVLTASAAAQTFVVDVNNGPGTDYTTIAAAVAAVPDGAVLDVRPGAYGQFTIDDKSLTVLARPGVTVTPAFGPNSRTPIRVRNLASHRSVTLRGLVWSVIGSGAMLECHDNRGTVVLDDCPPSPAGGQLIVTASDRVFVRDTNLELHVLPTAAYGALEATDSNVFVSGCTVRSDFHCLRQSGGRVELVDTELRLVAGVVPLGQAVVASAGGELVLHGDSSVIGLPTSVGLAASGTGSVVVDPGTTFQNLGNPVRWDQGIAVADRLLPEVAASTQPLGGTASATMTTWGGATGALFAGFAAGPISLPNVYGPLWLGPGAVLVASGSTPVVQGSYAVPNAPWLLGLQVTWQGAALAYWGAVTLSNPVTYGHH